MYFPYGREEVTYLKQRDKRLAAVIDAVGRVERPEDDDLFSSVVRHIIGQQISAKAQATVWRRMQDAFGHVTADAVCRAGIGRLQSLGMTRRKAEYILDFARKTAEGSFDLQALWHKTDEQAIEALCALRGIGVWTAEMILLFGMQRPDIFSFNDLAIQRGMRMVYHHRQITRPLFEKYRRRFHPYASVASLYLWAVAGGAVPALQAPASQKKKGSGREIGTGYRIV